MMIFYIVSFFTSFKAKTVAIISLAICFTIEFSQLLNFELLNSIRASVFWRLVFGQWFLISNFLLMLVKFLFDWFWGGENYSYLIRQNNTMDIVKLEKTLWKSACKIWWNEWLKLSNLSEPILGLIFLKFAQVKFNKVNDNVIREAEASYNWRKRTLRPEHYHAKWVIYLWEKSRYDYLLNLPESANIWKEINEAMREIEELNPELKGILPKSYNLFKEKSTLIDLLKNFNSISEDIEWDAFGGIYEFFLGKFALWEWQKGWEFFTPTSIVKLIVEIIEPYHGKIYNPACGSGGMFVQSLNFIKEHKKVWDEAA